MTLEKAKELLEEEYERAKKLEWVENPLAYALYHVWRTADYKGKRSDLADTEPTIKAEKELPPCDNIHQRIKKAREAKGWTMQELAEKVGYAGFTAISKVENGERSINHEMLKKYADVLEVSPLWLLYGRNNI